MKNPAISMLNFPAVRNHLTKPAAFVIIPTYNQAGTLPRMVANIFSSCADCYHVVIIDDNSTDDTIVVAEALRRLYSPRLHVLCMTDD
jgi:GT2 family glycosyltransferase